MSFKKKILIFVCVAVMMFTMFAVSAFAYEAGQTLTFKDTYTEAELSAYLTEYKDVDGVYYAGDEITQGVMPNLLSFEEDYSELVVLYRGSNFSTSNGDSTWLIIGKYTDGSYRIMYHYSDNSDEIYIYKTATSAWGSAGVPEITVDGTFTLTDSQFSSTGLLWAVSGDSTSGGTTTGGNTSSGTTTGGTSGSTSGAEGNEVLSTIGTVLLKLLGWIGLMVTALLTSSGALYVVLPLFAITIVISLVLIAIKVIKSLIWGA